MSSIITGTNCRSSTCCDEVDNYVISNSVEQSITDIALPWGYYLMREGSDNLVRVDETGQEHHLGSVGESTPGRVGGLFTPWANEFEDSDLLQSEIATMDSLADPWAFCDWLYLGTPPPSGTLFMWATGTKNMVELKYFYNDPDLTFRLQVGYYPPPNDAIPYYNFIVLNGLPPPLNAWYFVAASFAGPSISVGTPEDKPIILRVNNTSNIIPALAIDSETPPLHVELSERFYIGPMEGIAGPIGIWTPDHLTEDNLEHLWNDGSGIALSF